MIVEIIHGHYEDEEFKSYVKLKHILSFDTEHNTIFFKKNKVGFPWISSVENFYELLELWKEYYNNL